MFDLSWAELLLVAVVALFAFGPEDVPKMMYNAGKVLRRLRYMRYALTNQFENFMDDIEQKAQVDKANPQKAAIPTHDPHEFDEMDADAGVLDDLPEIEPETRVITEADLNDDPDIRPDQPDQPR